MTSEAVLVLAWLTLAHLVADFLLQTDAMVEDKFSPGRRGWQGLGAHGLRVGLCLVPFALAYGVRGLLLLAVVTLGHVAIDRWKVGATRRAEARALLAARRSGEPAAEPGEGLGRAWTPLPGALFIVDQILHALVIVGAWALLLAPASAQPLGAWSTAVDAVLRGADRSAVHAWTLAAVVVVSLAIVNIRAGALFVATLVRPPGSPPRHEAPADPPLPEARATSPGWRVRLGPLAATVEPLPGADPAAERGAEAEPARDEHRPAADGHAPPERIGATIGVLERLLIVAFVLTGSTAAIGFVVAAKTLARFKQLDDRDFAEYYLLGTLASVAVALASALLAQAALATVPGPL